MLAGLALALGHCSFPHVQSALPYSPCYQLGRVIGCKTHTVDYLSLG